ncbi:MAG: hypothetical protein KAU60_09780, partial [Desulfobacterales bacterium]|nr:hypothetical protein [Desulfobacterales bacterium]
MATEEWQLLISGLTLLLTPIASAVVVGIQLRKSHSWWLKQQQYLLEKERIQRKFDLYERTAHILARLNSLLLEQQVFLFSRNKCEYMLHHCLKPDQVKRGIVNSEYQRYRELAVKQNEKIREKKAEFQQIGFLGRAYFGLDFEKHTMQVASSLKQAEQQLVPLPELIQTCNSALQQGKTLDDALSLLDPIFDQRWEALNPKDRVAILLETIYRELTIEKEGQSGKGEFS